MFRIFLIRGIDCVLIDVSVIPNAGASQFPYSLHLYYLSLALALELLLLLGVKVTTNVVSELIVILERGHFCSAGVARCLQGRDSLDDRNKSVDALNWIGTSNERHRARLDQILHSRDVGSRG